MLQFDWDPEREWLNFHKHGVDFNTAKKAFLDPNRLIFVDQKHSENEKRFMCLGNVNGRILTVRFVYREDKIRIFGAGYWRNGKDIYEKEKKNQIRFLRE